MAKGVETKRPDASTAEYLSEAQLNSLLGYVKGKAELARKKGTTRAIFDELIILLLVNTGLRARELCNLNIADVPTSHGRNAIWVRDSQGNVTRAVDVDAETARSIDRFVRLYRKGAKPEEPLLISERGNRLIYISLYSKVRNIGQKAGIERLHPYMLRRTYLVRLYERERDLRLVQMQGGHARPATTAMYAIPNSKTHKRAAKSTGMVKPPGADPTSASDKQPASADYSAPKQPVIEQLACDGAGQVAACEACGKPVPRSDATRIDSGQILCADCLREIRKGYA
ncbi:MAG TPA: tyrosine-type recombinase/integrase [Sedimentisphaerales bacterium]|nr:tyrosine-type recombinase/integrase [Sedimentisphaerales bacterium]